MFLSSEDISWISINFLQGKSMSKPPDSWGIGRSTSEQERRHCYMGLWWGMMRAWVPSELMILSLGDCQIVWKTIPSVLFFQSLYTRWYNSLYRWRNWVKNKMVFLITYWWVISSFDWSLFFFPGPEGSKKLRV